MTQFDSRLNLHKEAREALLLGDAPLFDAVIPRTIKAAIATGAGVATAGELSARYKELSEVIITWSKGII